MSRESRGRVVTSLILVMLAIIGAVVLVFDQRSTFIRERATQSLGKATNVASVVDNDPTPSINVSTIDGLTAVVLPPTQTPPSSDLSQATPLPDAPFNQTVFADGFPNTAVSVAESSSIVIGTVKDILPARWSTIDGKRPANPFADDSQALIFRPVIINVEQYLLGNQPSQQLTFTAPGGRVGQDSMEFPSDDKFIFQSGERVIVFGIRRANFPDGNARIDVGERYTLTGDGQAKNRLRTLALSQLLDEIRAALTPTPAAAIVTPVIVKP